MFFTVLFANKNVLQVTIVSSNFFLKKCPFPLSNNIYVPEFLNMWLLNTNQLILRINLVNKAKIVFGAYFNIVST